MRSLHLKIALLAGCLILGGAVFVVAQEDPFSKLTYPIPELGNCLNRTACEAYCDKSENMEACLDFAEKNNLMSQEELQQAKKFVAVGAKGPGGCLGKDACEEYCGDISRIDECVSFALACGPLFNDLGDHAGAYRPTTFPDGKVQPFFQSNGHDQVHFHLDVVAGHHHLYPFR